MAAPEPLLTTYTVGNGTPVEMAAKAASYSEARAIKIKLGGNADDESRIATVRAARPDVWLAVEANRSLHPTRQIGRASRRDRGCSHEMRLGVAASRQTKNT